MECATFGGGLVRIFAETPVYVLPRWRCSLPFPAIRRKLMANHGNVHVNQLVMLSKPANDSKGNGQLLFIFQWFMMIRIELAIHNTG